MSIALYILAAIFQMVVVAGAGAVGLPEPATVVLGVGTFLLCAWAFLASVHKSKRLLTEHGLTTLPDFAGTVIWFAAPFANFYVPWKRLATIRNSLSHYLKTGELDEHEGGRGATIILAVLYFSTLISERLIGSAEKTASEDELAFAYLCALAIWLASFIYSVVWLGTLGAKRAKAEKRLAGQGEPLAAG